MPGKEEGKCQQNYRQQTNGLIWIEADAACHIGDRERVEIKLLKQNEGPNDQAIEKENAGQGEQLPKDREGATRHGGRPLAAAHAQPIAKGGQGEDGQAANAHEPIAQSRCPKRRVRQVRLKNAQCSVKAWKMHPERKGPQCKKATT